MQNSSIFELRRRAQDLGCNDVADQLFALLLERATRHHDTGLEVVIHSPQPEGYKPERNRENRVYVIDLKTKQRAGAKLRRLRWDYAINCVMIADRIEPLRPMTGQGQSKTGSPDEIATLKAQVQVLIGRRTVPNVFDSSLPGPSPSGERSVAHTTH